MRRTADPAGGRRDMCGPVCQHLQSGGQQELRPLRCARPLVGSRAPPLRRNLLSGVGHVWGWQTLLPWATELGRAVVSQLQLGSRHAAPLVPEAPCRSGHRATGHQAWLQPRAQGMARGAGGLCGTAKTCEVPNGGSRSTHSELE